MDRHVSPEDPDLYALGALDGEEKQAFEAHVRSCPACAQELAAAQERAAMLGLTAPPVTPAPAVKAELMRRVRADGAVTAQPPAPRARFPWLVPALTAATILFAVLASWFWTRDERDVQQIRALEAQLAGAEAQSREVARTAAETDEMLGAPGTIHVVLAQQPGSPAGRAGVLYNPRSGAVISSVEIGPAPADKSYQLWLVPASGAPVSLGVFAAEERNTWLTAQVPPGLTAKAFAVTLEPKGGRPQPTGPKLLVGASG